MHDRLGKVRPLIDLSSKFSSLYDPSKDVAVDEAMIKFQGRSALKQYMHANEANQAWDQSVGTGG